MDGLSGAASGIAVVSLAIQLGDSVKKLCEFWSSVKEAPDDVRAITADLQLLSSVLAGIASEEQHSELDPTLVAALKACRDNVIKLVRIANDMEPGFASRKPRIRIWTAFRAAIKGESIQKSQRILEGLKSTLTLALQNHHSRLNRVWHQSQQQDITTILRHLSSLNLDQPIAFRDEASRFHQTIHDPTQGVGFEVGRDVAGWDVAKILSRDQSRNVRSPPNSEDIHSTPGFYKTPSWARQRAWTMISGSLTQKFFGTIINNTRTRVSRPGVIVDDALGDEEYPYEHEDSFRILPAGWLLKLGFNYAYKFSIHDSSTQGWQFFIKPINLVPDDAPIFQYCEQGNIEKIRDLMSRNLASVRDVDSEGQTALHFAVSCHRPELCKFLIEAGADKTARTFMWQFSPFSYLIPGFRQDGLVDAIETCRIFEDSYDFWDEFGDGWGVLTDSIETLDVSNDKIEAEFFSWFLQSSRPDIKAYCSKDWILTVIDYASPEMLDSIGLLLQMGPPGIIDDKIEGLGITPLVDSILDHSFKGRRPHKVRMLLALGADPHLSAFWWVSNRVESPLSLAMYWFPNFYSFRDALRELNLHVEDIVRRELEQGGPLVDDGWQVETLSALLKLDFELELEPPEDTEKECSNCRHFFCKRFDRMVQPYWHDILERIKNGTYVQNARSDTQDVQSSSGQRGSSDSDKMSLTNTADGGAVSQDSDLLDDQSFQSDEELALTANSISRLALGKEELWCMECWLYFKKTGQRCSPPVPKTSSSDRDDLSEYDYSPFLFNT